MIRGFEWAASLLVVLGVICIAQFVGLDGYWHVAGFALGVVLLTVGVRLAIDVARAREDA